MSFIVSTVFGFFIEGIFIKQTKNKRFMLRAFWRALFHGSTKGKFLTTGVGILIAIFEIFFIAIATYLGGLLFTWLLERTSAFYAPIILLTIGSLYFIAKVRFAPRIRWYDWIGYSVILAISGAFIWLIIEYKWFGFA